MTEEHLFSVFCMQAGGFLGCDGVHLKVYVGFMSLKLILSFT